MLKNVDPLLSGELLKLLDELGHGDWLVVCDANFPAYRGGAPVVRLGEVSSTRAIRAILSVFPLDTFVEHPLQRMEADGDPSVVPSRSAEVLAAAIELEGRDLAFEVLPRDAFYAAAGSAMAVVHTLETEGYNNFILTKGVV